MATITDLQIDSSIPLRLDISTVQNTEIGKLYGIGSQTFILPGTKANNQFFKHAYQIGADGVPAMYNDVEAHILLDGEELLTGRFHLLEILTDETGAISYKVQVEDSSINFVTALEDKLIADADFSDYDHVYTANAVTASWLPNTDSGVLLSGSIFWPLCDYGTDDRQLYPTVPRIMTNGVAANDTSYNGSIDTSYTGIQPSQLLPAIRVRELIDVIFDQAGFRYTSSLIEGSDFDNLYMLPKAQEENGPVPPASAANTLDAYISSSSYTYSGSTDFSGTVPYDAETSDPGSNYNTGTYQYTTPTYGVYNISVAAFFSGPNTTLRTASLTLRIRTSTTVLAESTVEYPASEALTNLFKTQTVSYNGVIQGGQTLYVEYEVTVGAGSGNASIQFTGGILGTNQNAFDITEAPAQLHGATINMADQFDSETKSIDIMRGILKQFNAIMVPSADDPKTLVIENFDEWIRNGREIDWTDKLDNAQRIAVKNPVVEQPRELRIQNVDDADRFSKLALEDEPNFQYGTIRILNTSNLTSGNREITTDGIAPVVLGSTIISGSVDTDGNPTFNLSGNSFVVPHLYKFDNNAQTAYKFKPRIGYKVADLTPNGAFGGTIYLQTGSLTTYSIPVKKYATLSNLSNLGGSAANDLHFDNGYPDLIPESLGPNSGTTAYNNYYSTYVESLYWDEGRKIVASLYFSPEEYRDIRLNDQIQVKDQKYRINKISGYNLQEDDVVEVELIKLYPEYLPATIDTGSFTNGWAFTAGTHTDGLGTVFNGLHIASELTGANSYHGVPAPPTEVTRSVAATTWPLFTPTWQINSGSAIDGIGTAASYALTQFDHDTSGGVGMSLTQTIADPSTTNPGTFSLSGVIEDNVGNSGTWSANFIASTSYSPYNPESTASNITLTGVTLTPGRTYYVRIT